MRKLFGSFLFLAVSLSAQTYEHGAVIRTSTSVAAAVSALESLDSYQETRASILPTRLIDLPLAYNLPDKIVYALVVQPESGEDDAACAGSASSVALLPNSGTYDDGRCSYSYLPEYDNSTHNTLSSAISKAGTLTPPRRATLLFHRSPTTDEDSTPIWLVAWRKTIEHCN